MPTDTFCYHCNPLMSAYPGMIQPHCEYHRWLPVIEIQPYLLPGYVASWKRGIWA